MLTAFQFLKMPFYRFQLYFFPNYQYLQLARLLKSSDIHVCQSHCESGEGIWLQGEAASEAHSIRDAEPHPVIPANEKNNSEIFPKKLRPCNNINLSTTDLCLPSTAWQWSVVCYYRICLFRLNNEMEYSLPFICLCLAVWLCLKMGNENMVSVRLLQIGATDLTVQVVNIVLIF